MKKNLITFGCSFTEGHSMGELGSWAYYLSKLTSMNLINKGTGGAGNELILNNLIGELELNSNDIKDDCFVVIQWSECLRQNVYFNNIFNPNLSRWSQITPESIHPSQRHHHNDGDEHTWLESHRKAFYPLFSSAEVALHKTYSNMLSAKNYLENNNIPYLFFDGINDHRLLEKNGKLFLKGSNSRNKDHEINIKNTNYNLLNNFYLLHDNVKNKIYDKNFYTELDMSMNEWLWENNIKTKPDFLTDSQFTGPYTVGNGGHPNDLASAEWAKLLIDYLKKIYPEIFVKSNLI